MALVAGASGATGAAGASGVTGATSAISWFDAQNGDQVPGDDADALYVNREDLASAKKAAEIWARQMAAAPRDFTVAWKLARARYWLGTNGLPVPDRQGALDSGIAAARSAIAIDATKPEGHFWLAANMGALAESFGLRQGMKYRGPIREAMETVLKLDPAFQQGSADRALGRWYYKVPGLFGGSKKKSEEHLRKSLAYDPRSVISRLFLADTLVDLNRKDEAKKELQIALDAPLDPDWAPEDRRFKEQAKQLLQKLSQ